MDSLKAKRSGRSGDKQTRRLAQEVLRRKERRFVERFGKDDDDKLLRYLAHCAKELGIGPRQEDVLGSYFLQKHFGGWKTALLQIGLTVTPSAERPEKISLMDAEVARQEDIRKRIMAAMRQNEIDFAARHENDSDEELFEYIRKWAKRLKHTPNDFEVLGGSYIKKRFRNDWCRFLHLAGLPGRPDFAPKFHKRLIYWDEAKKQLDIYVEECMQENTAKKVIYVAPVAETAV